MKIQVSFKSRAIPALMLGAVALMAFSFFFFRIMDNVVHGDLYSYGLQFNTEWAERYWIYARLIVGSLLFSLLAFALSTLLVIRYKKTHNQGLVFPSRLSSITGILLCCLSIATFTRLDRIVHWELYSYNLQFNYTWATKYWASAGLMIGLQSLAIAAATVASLMIIRNGSAVLRIDVGKLTCSLMLIAGIIGLAYSIDYNSQLLAFIGLGLVFWGATLIYVRGQEYSKTVLLEAMSTSPLTSLDQVLQNLEYKGQAVYLPPRYLKDSEVDRVCILKQENTVPPSREEIARAQENWSAEYSFMLLTPPGNDLVELFEKVLNIRFSRVDLDYVCQHMPELLIDKLEIAEEVNMEIDNDIIRVTMKSPTMMALHKDWIQNSNTAHSMGNPVSSAFACMLASASGKLIELNKTYTSKDGKTVTMEYLTREKLAGEA
jgi:hypothetical protein